MLLVKHIWLISSLKIDAYSSISWTKAKKSFRILHQLKAICPFTYFFDHEILHPIFTTCIQIIKATISNFRLLNVITQSYFYDEIRKSSTGTCLYVFINLFVTLQSLGDWLFKRASFVLKKLCSVFFDINKKEKFNLGRWQKKFSRLHRNYLFVVCDTSETKLLSKF